MSQLVPIGTIEVQSDIPAIQTWDIRRHDIDIMCDCNSAIYLGRHAVFITLTNTKTAEFFNSTVVTLNNHEFTNVTVNTID